MLVTSLLSCAIDAPPELPNPPRRHPTIQTMQVVPPASRIILSPPTEFIVPLEVWAPSLGFEWNVFLDYDPAAPSPPVLGETVSGIDGPFDGGTRLVSFGLPLPTDTQKCHVIEFVVALGFYRNDPYSPNAYGGDSIVWYYNPSGSPGACPPYDTKGQDGSFPADADRAADGGP